MNVVVEPPAIAVVAVFRTVNKFVEVVVNKPAVRVSLLVDAKLRAELRVTPLALLMITPPVPENVAGNSVPVVCNAVPLYSNVEEVPYVSVPDTVAVAVPCIDSIPFTVVVVPVVIVFTPEAVKVTLLNVVVVFIVCATPPNTTVLVPGLNTEPVPVHAVALVVFTLMILELPFSVPAVRVTLPVNVCVPEPMSMVPPEPLMVKATPLILPEIVAVPAVLVIDTVPVVVNPETVCVVALLAMITPPEPDVKVPLIMKSPPTVSKLAPGVKVAPVLIVSGTFAFRILAADIVMAPVLAIIIPPVAANGVIHSSAEAKRAVEVLYCKVALVPYVTTPVVTVMVAVPSIESIPFTVGVVANVFTNEPDKVRLL